MDRASGVLVAIAVACSVMACGDAADDAGRTSTRKGMFELVPDDFERHDHFAMGATLSPTDDAALTIAEAWNDTGLSFAKGELLMIEASGTISGQVLPDQEMATVGPEGMYGWLGGVIYVLINHTALALYGRIGNSVFLIGSGTVLLAPAEGNLEIAINHCEGCDVTGDFDIVVHTELSGDIELSDEPFITDNSVSETATVTVEPMAGWVESGMTVLRGEKIFVDANGSFTVSGLLPGTYDANGAERWLGGDPFLIPGATAYRLFARVGERIVRLGTSSAFLAPRDGALELAINYYSADTATGDVSVNLGRGVRPARGLESVDPADMASSEIVVLTADDSWKSTTLTVERGDPIVFSATGQLSGDRISSIPGATTLGPDGHGYMGGYVFLLGTWPIFAVHGRIGDQLFFVGSSQVMLAPASGTIELASNNVRCWECIDCLACEPYWCEDPEDPDTCHECDPDVCPGCDPTGCIDCDQWCGNVSGQFDVTVAIP